MKRISVGTSLLAGLIGLAALGCGGKSGQSVSGTVTLDSQPLADAEVSFESLDRSVQIGGDTVRTDAQGKFEIVPDKRKAGLKPGKFGVYVTKWVDPKTKEAPAPEDLEMKKAEGKLRNIVPPKYSNREEVPPIVVEIKPGKNEGIKIDLSSK